MHSKSDIFRENAQNCMHLSEEAFTSASRNRYKRMADAWLQLAAEQEWLDGVVPPIDRNIKKEQKSLRAL